MAEVRTEEEVKREIGRLAEELMSISLREQDYDDDKCVVLTWVLSVEGQTMERAQDDSYATTTYWPDGQRWTSSIGLLQVNLNDLLNNKE